jgi:16S rRNA (adenine1518-N6/adenine1519-N6)-dimethyltransferase
VIVPRKRFGQHFLIDAHYVARIIDAIDPHPGDNIVEIGPGQGALTGALVERARHVVAIEIDRDLAARLRSRFGAEALTLHETDALASWATCPTTSARRCSSTSRRTTRASATCT